MLSGFECMYGCVIAFNRQAKACVNCEKLEQQQSETVPSFT